MTARPTPTPPAAPADSHAERYRSDSALVESLERVAGYPDILDTPQACEVYTNGACWYLAWWLHELAGLPIAAIGGYDESLDDIDATDEWDGFVWTHVGVWVKEELLDVTGLLNPDDVLDAHGDDEDEEQGIYNITAEEFTRVIFDPFQMSERAAQVTRYVAERLLARHGLASR